MEQGFPVLDVLHGSDGAWYLLCGGDEHDVDNEIRVIHREHLFKRDPSLVSLADLPAGFYAERQEIDFPWTIVEMQDDGTQHAPDCACCRTHGQEKGPDGFDLAERKCINDIEQFGLHILQVAPSDSDDGFSYTVGLFDRYEHPELIVFGQKPTWCAWILNFIADEIREGKIFEEGPLYSGLVVGFDCRFKVVHTDESYHEYLGWDLWYYKVVRGREDRPPVLQLIWPDTSGNFPESPQYQNRYRQPMLS